MPAKKIRGMNAKNAQINAINPGIEPIMTQITNRILFTVSISFLMIPQLFAPKNFFTSSYDVERQNIKQNKYRTILAINLKRANILGILLLLYELPYI